MSAFTKCFRPVSNYPSDFTDLVVWLRADSGVTFDIPNKRVSAWSDKSGQSNDVVQTAVAEQPLREGYGGQNDKAYFKFNGTSNSMFSSNNSPITPDFTIFEVSNIKTNNSSVFSYDNGSGVSINIMATEDNSYYARVTQEIGIEIEAKNTIKILGKSHIGVLTKTEGRIALNYYDSTSSTLNTDVNGAFDPTLPFNADKFHIGNFVESNLLYGDVQEVIVYNRALSDSEIADVRGYLNLKYKIY
tara:strand:- start:76 stop:810 length:735 start_codon:yes stop_codon:yes gene_type:complete